MWSKIKNGAKRWAKEICAAFAGGAVISHFVNPYVVGLVGAGVAPIAAIAISVVLVVMFMYGTFLWMKWLVSYCAMQLQSGDWPSLA